VYREPYPQGGPDGTSGLTLAAGLQDWIQADLGGTTIDPSEDAAVLLRFSRTDVKDRSFLQFIGRMSTAAAYGLLR
jgi:hypothetical protein